MLLGPHRGDNHQVLALAEGLGVPYRPIQMRYHWFAHLPAAFRSVTISHLQPEARAEIAPPWPSLVIGIGQRSVPVARYIKEQSGGRTTIVRLGDPMVSPSFFDLVITTTSICSSRSPTMSSACRSRSSIRRLSPDCAEARWLGSIPATAPADCDRRRDVAVAARVRAPSRASQRTLLAKADRDGGSVIAVTSPRTSSRLSAAARVGARLLCRR